MNQFTKRSMMMAAVLGLATLSQPAKAGLVLSVEAPKVQASSVNGATRESFDSFNTGTYTTLSTAVGTLTSPGMSIVAANQYGGAGGSFNYFAIGAESGKTTASLALNAAASYFGFWWSAADAQNSLQFFSKGTLVATFNSAAALASLSSAYLGNPTTGADATEKFAYLDFNATNGTTFDKIVFNNTNTSTGFEADNFAILNTAFASPGTVVPNGVSIAVPEPSSAILATLGGALGLGATRLRRRSAAVAA